MPLPSAAPLELSDSEKKQLRAIGRQRMTPRGIVLRINIILGAADGTANRVLARKLSTSVPTVLLWRKRYESNGLRGILEDCREVGVRSELLQNRRPPLWRPR